MEARKRYTVIWESVERRYKKQFDTLPEAEARFRKVLESDRLRFARLIDNADLLNPVTLRTELRVKR